MLIHQVAGKGKCVDIVHAADWPERVGGFVFKATGGMPVLFAVNDGKVIFINVGNSPAGNGATETRLVADQVGVAVLVRCNHRFRVDFICPFKLHFSEVACG